MLREIFVGDRRIVENCPAISLATLQRQGDFIPGGEGRLSLMLSGDGQTWWVEITYSLSDAGGLLFVSDATGWSQWLKLCRRTDTRGRSRWFFEDTGETYQKAYFANGRFASRQAHGLTYHAESLSRSQRQCAKLADEETSLSAAADRNEISEGELERLEAIEKRCNDAMSEFARKLEQPKLNKRARRERFEQEVEDARRRLNERTRAAPPLGEATITAITAQAKAAAPPVPDLSDWRAKSDHGFAEREHPHLNIAALMRLGVSVEGQRTATYVGWGEDWNPQPAGEIDLIVDLRDPAEPFALLVQREADTIKAQLFWTPLVKGDFNKPSRRFVDAKTGLVSKILMFERGLFAVRDH